MSTRTIIRTVVTPRTVTRRVGPAGADAEGGGVSSFTDLTDKASADLPAINTPLASALSNLSAQLSGKAPATGISPAAISGTAVITTDPRLSDARAPTAHAHPASEISDATATGRSILTAANQAAARSSGLGSGATGDALFTAASPAAARETLELGGAVIRKITTADVSRNNAGTGTTYTNDATLQSFAVDANSWYLVEFALLFTCTVNSGIKTQLLHPALATASAFSGRVFSSSSPTDAVANTSTVTTLHSVTAARTVSPISGYCRIRIGATGGTIALQWAQNASSADNTTLLAGSLMTVTKI